MGSEYQYFDIPSINTLIHHGSKLLCMKMARKPARDVLAENLKRLMESSDEYKTQKTLAKAAGLSQSHISYMLNPERHDKEVQLDTLEKLSSAFDMEVWQILINHETLAERLAETVLKMTYRGHSSKDGRTTKVRRRGLPDPGVEGPPDKDLGDDEGEDKKQ